MSAWLIYLFSILDNISTASILIALLFGIFSFIFFTIRVFEQIDDTVYCKNTIKFVYRTGIIAIVATVIGTLTPSKQDAMLIYALPKIVNNKQIQDLPPKLLQSINDTIDGYDQYIKRKLDDKGDKK